MEMLACPSVAAPLRSRLKYLDNDLMNFSDVFNRLSVLLNDDQHDVDSCGFGFKNVSKVVGWFVIKFSKDIHVPQLGLRNMA